MTTNDADGGLLGDIAELKLKMQFGANGNVSGWSTTAPLPARSQMDELVDAVAELRTMVKILLDAHLVREANEGGS